MAIHFKTIPHEEQRYPTVGDYFKGEGNMWEFRVSRMGNEKYEFLVFIHELVEWYLTQSRGISEESITDFDMKFESERAEGDLSEPGNSKYAPYHKEHIFAECIERIIAHELGVDWESYDKTVNEL